MAILGNTEHPTMEQLQTVKPFATIPDFPHVYVMFANQRLTFEKELYKRQFPQDSVLRLWCVMAPLVVVYPNGDSLYLELSDVQQLITDQETKTEYLKNRDAMRMIETYYYQSEKVREYWNKAQNVDEFETLCKEFLRTNDFYVLLNDKEYLRHYYDLTTDGDYNGQVQSYTTYASYSGFTKHKKYERNGATYARLVMLLEYYQKNHLPFDDCPENYRELVVPVSAGEDALTDWIYNRMCY